MKPKPLKEARFGEFACGDIVQFNRVATKLVGVVIRPASMMGDEKVHVQWITTRQYAVYGVLSYFPNRLRRYDEAL